MGRSFISAIILFLFTSYAQAGEIVCVCPDKECSEIRINFIPSNPGVYMTVEYSYGEKNLEGFAQVTVDKKENTTLYKLGQFIMVEKDENFILPLRDQVCN